MTFVEGVKKVLGLGDSAQTRMREGIKAEVERDMLLDECNQNLFDFNERLNRLIKEGQEALQRGNGEQFDAVMLQIHTLHQDRDEVRRIVIDAMGQGQEESMVTIRQKFAELTGGHTARLKKGHRKIDHERQAEDAVTRQQIKREGEAGRRQVDRIAGVGRSVAKIPQEALEQYMGLINAQNVVATQEEASLLKRMQAQAEQGRTSNEQQKEKEK